MKVLRHRGTVWGAGLPMLVVWAASACAAVQQNEAPVPSGGAKAEIAGEMLAGKQALQSRDYVGAERHFHEVLRADAASVGARMGLADAELALHAYEAAELDYRAVVASQPQMWLAHKNLVIVEAALGRWEEFDRERAVLRGARERGAEGISARESDVIDGFTVGDKHWIVREYFEPVGRSAARYNFEWFGPDGRVREYVSLELEAAAKAAAPADAPVRVGEAHAGAAQGDRYALNWYTGKAHGSVRVYPQLSEPAYEKVRADVLRWLRAQRTGAAR